MSDHPTPPQVPVATPVSAAAVRPPALPSPAAPVQDAERIVTLDVLRGAAVLGILLVNVQFFAFTLNHAIESSWRDLPPLDAAARLFTRFFAEFKFITIFSMLFGMGLAIMSGRAEKRGRPFGRLYVRRLLMLLVLGLLHGVLLWYGDILSLYALLGFIALLFRNARPRTLVIAAGVLFVLPLLGFGGCMAAFPNKSFTGPIDWNAMAEQYEARSPTTSAAATHPAAGGSDQDGGFIDWNRPDVHRDAGAVSPSPDQNRDREGADSPTPDQNRDREGADSPASCGPLPHGRGSDQKDRVADHGRGSGQKDRDADHGRDHGPTAASPAAHPQHPTPDEYPAWFFRFMADEKRIYQSGTWGEMVQHRSATFALMLLFANLMMFGGRCLGLFLLGIAMIRGGLFDDPERHRRAYRLLIVIGLAIGIPLQVAGLVVESMYPRTLAGEMGNFCFLYLGSMGMSLAYIGGIALIGLHQNWSARLRPLAAVGKMALTNYLSHSVICGLIFYGYGLGLFGRIGHAAALALVLVIFAAQLIISPLWLRRFRFGPIEWVWRSATYWQLQPMRREPPAMAGG